MEADRKAFIRKWRLKYRCVTDSLQEAGARLFAFVQLPPSQGRSLRTPTRSNGCMSVQTKDQDSEGAESADTAAMLIWALSQPEIRRRNSNHIPDSTQKMREVDSLRILRHPNSLTARNRFP
jgi:hypothetical protein